MVHDIPSESMPAQPPIKSHTLFHKDGSLWARGFMRGDVMHGPWEWLRKDGSKMRSGRFDNGAQVGAWTTYDKSGRIVKVTVMKPKR
jgi:antitoxin component YwqK of YwqJK toxin-antitoxin module